MNFVAPALKPAILFADIKAGTKYLPSKANVKVLLCQRRRYITINVKYIARNYFTGSQLI
jgi:hypothetical protein